MRNFWFSSDYHFGDDRYDLMKRPFDDVSIQDQTIIDNHNKVVAPDDIVYVGGDVVYQKADFSKYIENLAKMNGTKILIRGNHDRPFSDEQFSKYFVEIIPEGKGIDIDIEGVPCHITHYPTRLKSDRFNLIGHIHSAWKVQKNCFNIGVDVHHFRPVSTKAVLFELNAITNFYDEDVWVHNRPENTKYDDVRGKKTVYFSDVV